MRRFVVDYLDKMRGGEQKPPATLAGKLTWSATGAALGVALAGYLAYLTEEALFMASFGSSCVLVFCMPELQSSQPRNVIGGHVLGGLVGLVLAPALGADWWAMAAATGLLLALMLMTRTFHPPAGGTVIYAMMERPDWDFLFAPTFTGALILVAAAVIFINLDPKRRYPRYWI